MWDRMKIKVYMSIIPVFIMYGIKKNIPTAGVSN